MKRPSAVLTVALVFLWISSWSASTLAVETPGPQAEGTVQTRGTTLACEDSSVLAPQAATDPGCSASQCDQSCRLEGYDYGTCLGSYCICRFWFP